jgi:hypothetical protein
LVVGSEYKLRGITTIDGTVGYEPDVHLQAISGVTLRFKQIEAVTSTLIPISELGKAPVGLISPIPVPTGISYDIWNGWGRIISGIERYIVLSGYNGINDPWNVVVRVGKSGLPKVEQLTAVKRYPVILEWMAPDYLEKFVKKYNIYRDGMFLASTTLLSYEDSTVVAPAKYRYAIKPVTYDDIEGEEAVKEVSTGIKEDLNLDGKVDREDLMIAAAAFGSYQGHPRWNPDADINGDGRVDIFDLVMICKKWGYRY